MRCSTVVLVLLAAMAGGAFAGDPATPAEVSGTVYLDANANGRRDAGEKGLAGVGVHDGMTFAETGPDGRYRLKITPDPKISYRPAQTVSVSWPSETWPSTPWWRALGAIADAAAVDFGLRPDAQPLPFAFLHISDDHSSGAVYKNWAPDVTRMVPMARLIVNSGDLGYAHVEGAEKMFSSVVENSKRFPIPIFHIPGNHDISPPVENMTDDQKRLVGYGGYLKHLGPVRWSFNYGGCHFIGVDWQGPYGAFLAADAKRVAPGTQTFGFVHYRAGMGRVTHLFYGHTHIQARRGNATAVVNLSGNGGCNVGVVHQGGFDVIERCSGCKTGRPDYHSRRRCRIRQLTYTWMKSIVARRGESCAVKDQALKNATHTLDAKDARGHAARIEVDVTFEPGDAKRSGIRIGTPRRGSGPAGTPLEIIVEGNRIHIAGIPVPYRPRDQVKSVRLHVVVEGGHIDIYVDSLMHLAKRFAVDTPSKVTLVSEGGTATFKTATVWQLQ